MRGQTIKLYIMGDEFKNIKTAELDNWTGKAYIGERKHVKIIQTFEELSVPGIYLLLYSSPDKILTDIYIGEADEVNKRINSHFSQKDWWDKFIVFINSNPILNKAHVRWLENKFHKVAKENISSIALKNNQEPSGSKLSASDLDYMEGYFEKMMFVLNHLQLIDFSKISEESVIELKNETIFYINLTSDRVDENKKILQGKMIITKEGYRLLKGSFIEKNVRKSFKSHTYFPIRKKFETPEYMVDSQYSGCDILQKDIDFTSPSAAAAVVKNRAVNGRVEWQLNNGMTLDEYENQTS